MSSKPSELTIDQFDFNLPDSLIAQYPLEDRSASRMLVVDPVQQRIEHASFKELVSMIQPGDLLVFNNTRVIPARMFGQKSSGGKVEMLFERLLDETRCLCHMRTSRSPKPGAELQFEGGVQARVAGRQDALFELELISGGDWVTALEAHGHMPLPPYMQRDDNSDDRERYQTVYAETAGAVAAPTAGLHFDEAILAELKEKGVETAFVTLHVGAGTFQPVKVEAIESHQMHQEWLEVTEDVVEAVARTKQRGGRVVAVGTTSVRSLETAAREGELQAFQGDTDIFIYPGYRFQVVDALVTNFHLPKSTLIMLVSALAGRELVLDAYRQAIDNEYRFYSYGDAMFISNRAGENS